ncbi:MAG: succinate dehydrogenase, cytochrome b556 subunit [Pseudomonadota bacterium]
MADNPLSPHLQVYQPQLTSVLSITHRATGVFLSFGTVLLLFWLLAAAAGPATYETAQRILSWPVSILAMMGWSFALFYHLCNGVRHLFWDAGMGFELSAAYRSGYTVVGVSFVLTSITWLYVFLFGGSS